MTRQSKHSVKPLLKRLFKLCGSNKRTTALFLLTMLVCTPATTEERSHERTHRHNVLRAPVKSTSPKKHRNLLLRQRPASNAAVASPSPAVEPMQRGEPQLPAKV